MSAEISAGTLSPADHDHSSFHLRLLIAVVRMLVSRYLDGIGGEGFKHERLGWYWITYGQDSVDYWDHWAGRKLPC